MDPVQFEEQEYRRSQASRFSEDQKSALVRFVERMGVPEERVNQVLIGAAVLFLFLSAAIAFGFLGTSKQVLPQRNEGAAFVPGPNQ
ncbi:MAG TPA: hypothetical protein VFT82_00275 [Candidatus Paceibacterota bacterium]|nr:hypothetical protein [Candidatus Paceibacterota bacterium]